MAHLAGGALLSHRFVFLARDLLGLLRGDLVLATRCRAVRERRIVEFTGAARLWRAQGVIRPVDDQTAADLVQALGLPRKRGWPSVSWTAAAQTQSTAHGFFSVVLRPYLTREGGSLATA